MNPNDDASASVLALSLVRVFDAPRALVFRMWSDGEQMRQWCVPVGFSVTDGASDFRPGGAWRCCMVSPEGILHRVGGVYQQIVEPELLVMSHAWEDGSGRPLPGTILTLRFEDLGGQTRLSLQQGVFPSAPERDGHLGGWSECLDKLAAHLQQHVQP